MRISEIVNNFDTYLSVERNLAERTRKEYKQELRKFVEYIIHSSGTEPAIVRIDTQIIRQYLYHLQLEHEYKAASLARTIVSLRTFFKYCVQEKLVQSNPLSIISNPKMPKKLPIYLINSELQKLFSAPDQTNIMGIRDFSILTMLSFTGIRLNELVNITLKDLDLERETLKVSGKGSKERLVPLNKIVINSIKAYLERRPISDSEAIFLNKFGTRLSGRSVENIVKKYVRLAGINKSKISPHKLRHTFATLLHMKEVDIIEIQKLLGHASITSTQIYTHTNPEKLKRAVDKLDNLE